MTPAEKLHHRLRSRAAARGIADELRRRLPDLPIESEIITDAPVGTEDATLVLKTDGVAVLRVLGVAADLTRELAAAPEAIEVVPKVWPRSIWCSHSTGTGPLYSARDERGNILLCVAGSHAGEHEFGR